MKRTLGKIVVGLTMLAPALASSQTFLPGIDVSRWQGAINWASVRNDGVEFAFLKATQGNSYVDPTFAANIQQATAAGVLVGPYHFCDLDTDVGNPLDPVNEANHFVSVIKPYYDAGLYLPPVADVEGFPPFSSTAEARAFTSTWVQAFSDKVLAEIGVRPIIYGSLSKVNSYYTSSVAAQHELWLAWWKSSGTANPPTGSDTPLWGDWRFWQWTATGSIAGIAGDVDRDLFNGTRSELESLLWTTGEGGALSPLTTITNFNFDEGYFGSAATYSGSNQGILAGTTLEQTTAQAYEGAGSQRIVIDGEAAGWRLREVSGIGSPAANPATNLPLPTTGSIGFWLKTLDPGVTVQILIDDPTAANPSAIEAGVARSVTADGQWRLYEWAFDDATQWNGWAGGGDGAITGGTATIDSILLSGAGDATLYLDLVAHNPQGSLAPVVGDFNRDYRVDGDDLQAWQAAFGSTSEADATGDGVTDGADLMAWQRQLAIAPSSAAVVSIAAPEPGSITVTALPLGTAIVAAGRGRRR